MDFDGWILLFLIGFIFIYAFLLDDNIIKAKEEGTYYKIWDSYYKKCLENVQEIDEPTNDTLEMVKKECKAYATKETKKQFYPFHYIK